MITRYLTSEARTVRWASARQLVMLVFFALACLWSIRCQAVDLVGYVPYYRMNANYVSNILPQQLTLLDEVRYFGLSANGTGGITSQSGSVALQKNNIAAIKSIIDGLPADSRPRLNITLGGAGVDSVFGSVASSAANRTALAQNVAALLDETGATSVDIDWEHPDAGEERTTTYPALLKRIKEEIGPERRVYATVDPTVMIPNSVLAGADGIDGISLMTYDLGWWGNDPINPNDGEHSLHEYVVDAINAWNDPISANTQRPWVWTSASWGNNVATDKLGIGLPFYGRNVFGNGSYTYSELLSDGTPTGDGYYSISGQTVWIPDQATIEERMQLAHDEGLQHVIIWELGQDIEPSNPLSMLRIAADKQASFTPIPGDFNGDGKVDGEDLAQWQEDYGVNDHSDADGDGDTDGRDFLIWQRNITATPSLIVGATAVPEPGTLPLGACVLACLVARASNRFGFRAI